MLCSCAWLLRIPATSSWIRLSDCFVLSIVQNPKIITFLSRQLPQHVSLNLSSSCPTYLNLPSGSRERPVLLCMYDIPSGKESEDTDHLISPTEAAPVGAALKRRGKNLDQWQLCVDLIHLVCIRWCWLLLDNLWSAYTVRMNDGLHVDLFMYEVILSQLTWDLKV